MRAIDRISPPAYDAGAMMGEGEAMAGRWKRAMWVSLLCAAVPAGFSCFGMFTPAGSRSFDEMDGMIPFFAGCLAIAMVVAAIILWCIGLWRGRR